MISAKNLKCYFIALAGAMSIAVVIGYFILRARPHQPTCSITKNLPATMIMGQRYPLDVSLTLQWKHKPGTQTVSIDGDFLLVSQSWSIASPGLGYHTWNGRIDVMSVAKGLQRSGTMVVVAPGLNERTELGPVTVEGLLTPDDEFYPSMSAYNPTTKSFPYSLIGAILFGVVASAGFIFVLRPKRPQPEAIDPSEKLAADLSSIDEQSDSDPQIIHQVISNKVRHYIENAWGIQAVTLSTEEVLKELNNHQTMPSETQTVIRQYLNIADQLKYTPGVADNSIADHLNAARALISNEGGSHA